MAYVIKKVNNLAHGHEHKLLSPSGVNALKLPWQLIFAFLAYVIKKIDNLAHGHEHKLLRQSGVNALKLPGNRFLPFWRILSKNRKFSNDSSLELKN